VTGILLPNARAQAAAILIAWGANNPAVLHRNLTAAAEDAMAPVKDSGESERLELIGAIASAMRDLLEAGERSRAAQYLPLLRHLASPPPGNFELAYRC
jgi:hypothetical protein